MNKLRDDEAYNSIIRPILSNNKVSSMKDIKHHNSNRLEHSLKVSYYSYKIAKSLKLNYVEVARAGLLHDFYLERTTQYKKVKDKVKLYTTKHPQDAISNSREYFSLSEMEEDIIRTHMFPLDIKVPKYAESWVVSLVDKCVSTCEFGRKFEYQLTSILNIYLIFILNCIK